MADPKVDHPAYHTYACKLAERGFITYAPQNLYIFGDRFRTLQADNTTAETNVSTQPPIGHVSIKAAEVGTVYDLHDLAQADESGLAMPYLDHVAVNPGDGSTNTKFAIRGSVESPLYNRIIEIVHHEKVG